MRRYFFSTRSRMRRSPSVFSSTVTFCHATVIFCDANLTLMSDFGTPGKLNIKLTIPLRSVSVKLLLTSPIRKRNRNSKYSLTYLDFLRARSLPISSTSGSVSALSAERWTTRFRVVVVLRTRRASFQRRSNSDSSANGVVPVRADAGAVLLRASELGTGSGGRLLLLVSEEGPADPRGVKASSNSLSKESHLNEAKMFLLGFDDREVMSV